LIFLFEKVKYKLPEPYLTLSLQLGTPVKSFPWSANMPPGLFTQFVSNAELLGVWSLHLKQRAELSYFVVIPVLH